MATKKNSSISLFCSSPKFTQLMMARRVFARANGRSHILPYYCDKYHAASVTVSAGDSTLKKAKQKG